MLTALFLLASGAGAWTVPTKQRSLALGYGTGHGQFTTQPSWSSPSRPRGRSFQGRSLAAAPTMVLDQLAGRVSEALKSLGGVPRITEASIGGALKDVKRALLDSDVNLAVANAIVAGVKERAVGLQVIEGVTAEQQFVKLMYDELVEVMGGNETATLQGTDRTADENPQVILMAGLQGAGKTTSAGKLALSVVKDRVTGKPTGRRCLLAACDIYRPAAIKQLETLGAQIGVEVFSLGTDASPVEIALQALSRAKEIAKESGEPCTLIVDTAGRQVVDGPLMEELAQVKKAVAPDETLLVVDAMTGQEAATLTDRFNQDVGITGAILTKLDGDTRGGAAISVRAVSGCPVKLVGMGEKMAPLEPFFPDRLASRILGMGDVVSLVEQAQQVMEEKDAIRTMDKMAKATFDFDDFLEQGKMVSKMGGAASMLSMLPGMAGLDKNVIKSGEQRMKVAESIINSMTKKEKRDPSLLVTDRSARSRVQRIAKGSGRQVGDVQEFLVQFQQMRTMMSRMAKGVPGGPGGGEDEMAMASAPKAKSGNRASRRAKANKAGKGKGFGGGGFGK